jgi:hypothetical protein
MRCSKDVHHALAFAEQVIGDDAPMAAPPDGLGAHDRAAVLAAQFSQLRKACGERLRQGIVGIVPKAPHPPIGVRRWFYIFRLSSKTAKRGNMSIADLPRRQRFGEAVAVELRIGTGSRHRPHVDDEIDAGLPEQIDKFGDRPGGMADGEECVRVGSITWRTRSIAHGITQNYGQNTLVQPGLWAHGRREKFALCRSGIRSALFCSEMVMKDKFKIGDDVIWNSEAGRVSGTIVCVHTRNFEVNGYTHHASAEAPQYEIQSSKTQHIAFHKGSALTSLRD